MENIIDYFFLPEGDNQGQNKHIVDKKTAKLKLIKLIYNSHWINFQCKTSVIYYELNYEYSIPSFFNFINSINIYYAICKDN